ncbi:MAG TPA: serine/threonine-protein kinase, partial [Candidatus Dormibacteraeota bacterium]|nr:serine/threonine-protein kinase [Candidatus Dormibacteraeota bacterium]
GPEVSEVSAVPAAPLSGGRLLPLFGIWESVANDRYQITEALSLGLQSEVYRATDWRAEGTASVALKVFHEPDAAAARRVGRAIQAHLSLDGQPGIVSVHDVGVLEKHDQSYRYLAFPFAEGGTLADRLKQDPHNVDLVLDMASQILPALGSMHDEDMVHRDIKPDNILAGDEDIFELTDFGIVDLDRFRSMGGLTLQGERPPVDSAIEVPADRISGTLGFIAPEAFSRDGHIGPEVDVFAMGVVLFQGMTGAMPFASSGELQEYYLSVTRESPVLPHTLNSMVPAVLEELTMESLRKDPHDRPRVDELAARLQTV